MIPARPVMIPIEPNPRPRMKKARSSWLQKVVLSRIRKAEIRMIKKFMVIFV